MTPLDRRRPRPMPTGRVRFRPAAPQTEVMDVQPPPGRFDPIAMRFPRPDAGAGVVHVGAHTGEELELYIASGFRKILLVEANPAVIPRLSMHARFWRAWLDRLTYQWGVTAPDIRVLHAAASDEAGIRPFFVSPFPVLSSLLEPLTGAFGTPTARLVPSARVDDLVAQVGWAHADVGLVVIDAQGAEMVVLRGAAETLRNAHGVVAEVNFHVRYRHQAPPHTVIGHLTGLGFTRAEVIDRDDTVGRVTVLFERDPAATPPPEEIPAPEETPAPTQ